MHAGRAEKHGALKKWLPKTEEAPVYIACTTGFGSDQVH